MASTPKTQSAGKPLRRPRSSTPSTWQPGGINALDFAHAARSLRCAAGLRDLVVPDFVSPPRRADLNRSIRRRGEAGDNLPPVVAVRLRGRPREAVLADMVEGIVVANRLSNARADLVRSALWLSLDNRPSRYRDSHARVA